MNTPFASDVIRLQEAAKRLRIAKQNLAYKTAIEAITNPGKAVICGKNRGSGKWATSESWQARTALLLGNAGFTYHSSNEAPKGGKAGDRITVTLPQ